ncbi:hypothetical protein DS878_05560 [Marinobacter sp. F3R11]|nr:hypothetical protein DS878_05560 [Marinobacter sp. F3R11]
MLNTRAVSAAYGIIPVYWPEPFGPPCLAGGRPSGAQAKPSSSRGKTIHDPLISSPRRPAKLHLSPSERSAQASMASAGGPCGLVRSPEAVHDTDASAIAPKTSAVKNLVLPLFGDMSNSLLVLL